MNRRDFIKNSLLVVGCTGIGCISKVAIDYNKKYGVENGVFLSNSDLALKYKDKSELPKNLRLDACSMCQLNCTKCYMRGAPDAIKNGCGTGYLKFGDFQKLVDENEINSIELSNSGEIFLNPELIDIIKYGHDKNVNLTADAGVNLNFLTDRMAEALVKYQFKSLTVSIDGATPEVYSIYRRGGYFKNVIKNIKKINFYKQKYSSPFPQLTYKFIIFGHNEHEIDKAAKLAKKLDMKIKFAKNYCTDYSPVKNPALVKQKTGIDTLTTIDEDIINKYLKNNKEWLFCQDLWNAPQINWDGKILGCCRNYDNSFGGNVFKDGLLKALNNNKFVYAKSVLKGKTEALADIPCTYCSFYKAIKQHHITL